MLSIFWQADMPLYGYGGQAGFRGVSGSPRAGA